MFSQAESSNLDRNMYTSIPRLDGLPPSAEALRCFEVLAATLLSFASRHSLFIRKYYHGQPMWAFHFLHPKGGFGSIQIHAALKSPDSYNVAISSHWWVDDFEKCQRESLSTKSISLSVTDPEQVSSVLEGALTDLVGQRVANLSSKSQTMPRKRDDNGDYVFSEFERAQRLPT
jgi:hypothetical protein